MRVDEQTLLVRLQRGLPLARRPFEALADELGCREADVLAFVEKLRGQGLVRRFGAVFDTRRLGYRSVLCAAQVPAEACAEAAARLTPLKGVTHCYLRERLDLAAGAVVPSSFPNLWFTLSYPSDVFAAIADEVRARLWPHALDFLPATRRYKIDVVFGAATRAREEEVSEESPLTATDRAVVRVLQGDTVLRADYFAGLAEQAGVTEWDLLSRLEIWRRTGRLKRIGLLLAHRAAGWTANGMCCWSVAGDTTEKGRALAACAEVTHCYERPAAATFPYNLFAMVHAHALDEAAAQFNRLQTAAGLSDGVLLVSTHEYKKTSMTFFVD